MFANEFDSFDKWLWTDKYACLHCQTPEEREEVVTQTAGNVTVLYIKVLLQIGQPTVITGS